MNGSKFTILGESLSGKTCYLPAMYCEMSQDVNGYSIVAQTAIWMRHLNGLTTNQYRKKGFRVTDLFVQFELRTQADSDF